MLKDDVLMKHCPKCGASESEKQFIGQFCVDCYIEDHPDIVIIPSLELPVCVHCGRLRVGGRWHKPSEKLLSSFLKRRVKTQMENVDVQIEDLSVESNRIDLVVSVCGSIEGSTVCVELPAHIKLVKTQCPVCSKIKGEYWEAKVQVRGPRDMITLAVDDARQMNDKIARTDERARIFQIKELKEGVDLYLGSKKVARDLVKRMKNKFHAEVKRTRKLTGEDVHKGKRIYKETFSVRLGGPAKDKRSKSVR